MVDIVATATLGGAWDVAVRQVGDQPWLVFLPLEGKRSEFTYREFDRWVTRTCEGFAARGITKGTIVAMQLRNCPEFIACLLALAKLGAITVPLGAGLTPRELLVLYRKSGAEWAIIDSATREKHEALRTEHGVVPKGLIETSCDGTDLSEASVEPTPVEQPSEVTSDDVAEIMFTSGTTAEPKGVLITHANMVYSGHYAIWQASLRPYDRIFTTMPECHSNFQLVAMTGAIIAGACLVLCERYSAHRFWEDARAEDATVIQLTAMIARTLLLQPPSELDRHHRVRETLYFMPLGDDEKVAFEQRFGVRFMNSYGSTESVCWVLTDPPQGERRWPSVGRVGLGYEVAILDASGQELGPGEAGEIVVRGLRGRTVMAGYYDDPGSTQQAFTPDGWLHTGDTGYYDADGWFYFIDRSKNLIKRSGQNISACEVEVVLGNHPMIAEAAVIGVPDPIRDQAIKAFVQLAPGSEFTAEQIQAYCAEHLAPVKVPEFVEFVTDFPRTPSMKIEKRSLS